MRFLFRNKKLNMHYASQKISGHTTGPGIVFFSRKEAKALVLLRRNQWYSKISFFFSNYRPGLTIVVLVFFPQSAKCEFCFAENSAFFRTFNLNRDNWLNKVLFYTGRNIKDRPEIRNIFPYAW